MKHLKIVMLALTLVFSVAAIAAPKNDKTPKTPKAHKTNKAIKKENKKMVDCYYFKVSNLVLAGTCNPTTNPITLTFPTTAPSSSPTPVCDGGSTYYCWVGFPGYKLVNGVYHPSTAPNGGTEITNYCSFTCSVLKDATN